VAPNCSPAPTLIISQAAMPDAQSNSNVEVNVLFTYPESDLPFPAEIVLSLIQLKVVSTLLPALFQP
jgi:hypothetical protein